MWWWCQIPCETQENRAGTRTQGFGQCRPSRHNNKVYSRANFQVCHSSFSHYFLFSFKSGHSKTWGTSHPSEFSLLQAYYLNHWRPSEKTGHPIKPWERPPLFLTCSGELNQTIYEKSACVVLKNNKTDRQSSGAFYFPIQLCYIGSRQFALRVLQ